MVLLSHPTGNANVRATANAFLDNGLLAEFHTSIASFPGSVIDRIGGIKAFGEIRRRRFAERLQKVTRTSPLRETLRLISSKVGLAELTRHETGVFSIDSICKNIDVQTAKRLLCSPELFAGVYAYEDAALQTFTKAKQLGLLCLYDLPIGYWRAAKALMESENEMWPEWVPTITGNNDSVEKLARKDLEIELSDRIFVASSFTAKTLNYFPGKTPPITVIPYGFPPVCNERVYKKFNNRRLKILFVGGLSQRKGIAYLFEAVEHLKEHVDLTLVGHKATPDCLPLNKALMKHRWIPTLPHSEILSLMSQHDVLIFASLFEGFGLVITEAMSQGTPVITTDRTAGPDLIQHGQNGWLIEAGSTSSLIKALEQLLFNPSDMVRVGKEAMETARLRPWEVYGKELAAAVTEALNSNNK